jgi:hypothetical protein
MGFMLSFLQALIQALFLQINATASASPDLIQIGVRAARPMVVGRRSFS